MRMFLVLALALLIPCSSFAQEVNLDQQVQKKVSTSTTGEVGTGDTKSTGITIDTSGLTPENKARFEKIQATGEYDAEQLNNLFQELIKSQGGPVDSGGDGINTSCLNPEMLSKYNRAVAAGYKAIDLLNLYNELIKTQGGCVNGGDTGSTSGCLNTDMQAKYNEVVASGQYGADELKNIYNELVNYQGGCVQTKDQNSNTGCLNAAMQARYDAAVASGKYNDVELLNLYNELVKSQGGCVSTDNGGNGSCVNADGSPDKSGCVCINGTIEHSDGTKEACKTKDNSPPACIDNNRDGHPDSVTCDCIQDPTSVKANYIVTDIKDTTCFTKTDTSGNTSCKDTNHNGQIDESEFVNGCACTVGETVLCSSGAAYICTGATAPACGGGGGGGGGGGDTGGGGCEKTGTCPRTDRAKYPILELPKSSKYELVPQSTAGDGSEDATLNGLTHTNLIRAKYIDKDMGVSDCNSVADLDAKLDDGKYDDGIMRLTNVKGQPCAKTTTGATGGTRRGGGSGSSSSDPKCVNADGSPYLPGCVCKGGVIRYPDGTAAKCRDKGDSGGGGKDLPAETGEYNRPVKGSGEFVIDPGTE